MRVLTSVASVRVLSVFAVLATLCAAPMGCGDTGGGPVPGNVMKEATEVKKANTTMEDFVNQQKKAGEKAPEKAPEKAAEKK
jgi:hypothetical protein